MDPGELKNLVTVAVPAYNMCQFLAEALESLLAQTYPHFEALVIDDGSIDCTPEVAARYLPGGERFDPRVVYIRQANQGKVAALNNAIARARGEFFAILDADDTWPPQSLEARVRALAREPGLVAVYGDANYMDEQGRVYRVRRSRPVKRQEELIGSVLVPIIGTTILARVPAMRDMLPLDTSYTRTDDAFINVELYQRGRLRHVPEIVLNYRNYRRAKNPWLRIVSTYHLCRLIARHYRGPVRWYYQAKQIIICGLKLAYEIIFFYK